MTILAVLKGEGNILYFGCCGSRCIPVFEGDVGDPLSSLSRAFSPFGHKNTPKHIDCFEASVF